MLTVEQLIGDLLIQNNCVIIPSFGGFVAQRVSAKIDAVKGTMIPPRKSVMFNKQLINNDGLLIAAFSQAQSISYAEAAHQVNEHIQLWEANLQSGQRITIDRVGILFYDQERNLCFEQDRFYNLLLQSFGLSSVHFVSTSDAEAMDSRLQVQNVVKAIELQEEKIGQIQMEPALEWVNEPVVPVLQVVREEQDEVGKVQQENTKRKTAAWRYVAAACMLPIAFYSFWIPVKTDVLESGVITLTDFNPFHKPAKGAYQSAKQPHTFQRVEVKEQLKNLPKEVSTFSYELDEDTYVPVSLTKKKEVPTETPVVEEQEEKVIPTPAPKPEPAVTSGKGQIIVGSYSNRENAQELVDLLAKNNIKSTIIENAGKIRVSAGSSNQFKSLEPQLKALGIAGWILN